MQVVIEIYLVRCLPIKAFCELTKNLYLCALYSNMADRFLTIERIATGIYKEKGSKFLAFAEPIAGVQEAQERIAFYKKQYYDARHVCYAYVAGADGEEYRINDDGEPSGTAGRPILGQLHARGLTNVLIVVVRYFGGILLGTGGLTVAYKQAAADALGNAAIVERAVQIKRELRFPYEKMNDVMRVLKETNARIVRQDFDNECIIECYINKEYEGRI